jgi:hypothetical protein
VPARVIAFARVSSSGGAAIAIAPHLVARFVNGDRPPAIGEMWKTSRVHAAQGTRVADVSRRLHRRGGQAGDGKRKRLAVCRPGAKDAPCGAARRGVNSQLHNSATPK